MRRRLLVILIFLLAGAVMNVAVAWGFAAWSNPLKAQQFASDNLYRPGHTWSVLRQERFAVTWWFGKSRSP